MIFPKQIRVFTLMATLPLGLVACGSLPQMEERLANMALSPDRYVARPGDTVESIAYRYKIDPAELAAMNPQLIPNANIAEQQVVVHLLDDAQNGTLASSSGRQILNTSTFQSSAGARTILAPQPTSTSVTEAVTQPTLNMQAPLPVNDLDYGQIKEIPASANSSQVNELPQSGYIEEVVPDELDYATLPPATPTQLNNPNVGRNIVSAPSGSANIGWVWPTYGEVAREFAPSEAGGQGIDIAGVPGQQIKAVSGGTVVYAGRDVAGGDGKLIILRHADGLMTTYSHARQLFVAEDDVVNGGDVIASLGANARNESVLRFEVRQNGNPLNPMQFLGN